MDILEQITAVKREEVKTRKVNCPVTLLEKSAFFSRQMPSFLEALAQPGPSIIGEFKRRSPSRGNINPSADILKVATGYQKAGTAALSVLTDIEFFGGQNSDLQAAAGLLKIPVLRKDFVVDEYQVAEAKSIGAAAILLIASILTKQEIITLSGLAISLGMDVLFEIHGLTDLDKISGNINIIGVNNRDLKTFEVSMENSEELFRYLPENIIKVAESGFRTPEDVRRLFEKGYDAFLIGESFMRSDNPGSEAARFIEALKSPAQ